ncbi:class I SAM-dependent methyltransferase [Candidatus Methylocalor cossyra]|uniref:Trans-aconitate methyltransferase n=1 Tax=Candidatus Methylocalor cossyra TaxID=3108543 RepID=A0ABM9NGG4_9GAMM
MYRWNPEDYARHSSGQEAWARELLTGLALSPEDRVLDIGCGDGRITAELARRVPAGAVVGVDLSEDMVLYASNQFPTAVHPNLTFRQADARDLPFEAEFTLVFSNAALHWVRDHRPVLAGIARALQPGGRCRMEMGGRGNAAALLAAFEAVAGAAEWQQDFLEGFELPFGFHDVDDYRRWLEGAGLRPGRVQRVDKDMVHADRTAFLGWLRTAWHPYSARVAAERRGRFLEAVVDRYLSAYPPDRAGQIHVTMVRLQVEAYKPVPGT